MKTIEVIQIFYYGLMGLTTILGVFLSYQGVKGFGDKLKKSPLVVELASVAREWLLGVFREAQKEQTDELKAAIERGNDGKTNQQNPEKGKEDQGSNGAISPTRPPLKAVGSSGRTDSPLRG